MGGLTHTAVRTSRLPWRPDLFCLFVVLACGLPLQGAAQESTRQVWGGMTETAMAQALIPALLGKERVHILVVTMIAVPDWPTLFNALTAGTGTTHGPAAGDKGTMQDTGNSGGKGVTGDRGAPEAGGAKAGRLKSVRVTFMVPLIGTSMAARKQEDYRRLCSQVVAEGEARGVPVEASLRFVPPIDFTLPASALDPQETLVVACWLTLQILPDEQVLRHNPRNAFLKVLRCTVGCPCVAVRSRRVPLRYRRIFPSADGSLSHVLRQCTLVRAQAVQVSFSCPDMSPSPREVFQHSFIPLLPSFSLAQWLRAAGASALVVVDIDSNLNTQFFLPRFEIILRSAQTVFETFDEIFQYRSPAAGPGGPGGAFALERLSALNLINCAACDGLQRYERAENMGRWRERLKGMGFVEAPYSEACQKSLSTLLSHPRSSLPDVQGFLSLRWDDKPLLFVGAWT